MRCRTIAGTLVLAAAPATALAATPPGPPAVRTDSAINITDRSADLRAGVNPRGLATTYYFQYGRSAGYGRTTKTASAGSGTKRVEAVLSVRGLTKKTLYHFRVVAQNSSGRSVGGDRTFRTRTPQSPNQISIAANPGRVRYGRSTSIYGQLIGTGHGGVQVQLQQTPSPFTAPLAAVGPAVTTASNGAYAFSPAPTVSTKYRVVAQTSPPTTSALVEVGVLRRIKLRVAPRR